jgi:hypothetical protein
MRNQHRKYRPQIKDLISLKALLPDSTQAILSPHFKCRTRQRDFSVDLIRKIWNYGEWRPYQQTGWTIDLPIEGENLVWSLGVDFCQDDLPTLSTICTRSRSATVGWTYERRNHIPEPGRCPAALQMGGF